MERWRILNPVYPVFLVPELLILSLSDLERNKTKYFIPKVKVYLKMNQMYVSSLSSLSLSMHVADFININAAFGFKSDSILYHKR